MLSRPDIALVLNLTIPAAHAEVSLRVLEIMEGIGTSSRDGRAVPIESRVERPAPLPDGLGPEPAES